MLEKGIRHYSDFGSVAIIEDLNARTASLSDEPVSCEGIDKYIESLSGSNFAEADLVGRRFSLDRKSDSSGLRLLGICKEAGLRIANGRVGADKGQGEFTYQSTLGNSVIDYVLLQPEFFKYVTQFIVHDLFTFSDHAPLQRYEVLFPRPKVIVIFTKLPGIRAELRASETPYQITCLT